MSDTGNCCWRTDKPAIYDPASTLVDDEEVAVFMANAFATGDAGFIAPALGVIACAKGVIRIAETSVCHASSSTACSVKKVT